MSHCRRIERAHACLNDGNASACRGIVAGSSSSCYNDCNARGNCVPPGVCACRPPWRGYDCSDPHSSTDDAAAASAHGFIYVHSPPATMGLAAMRRSHFDDQLYKAEELFFERLMADANVRTRDPRRALLWYVPTWLVAVYSNTVYDKGVVHYRALAASLEASPLADAFRSNWSRHIFFAAGDKGACLWPRGPMYMSHWGLRTPWKAMMLPNKWLADALVSARAHEPPCADGRDVILPPLISESIRRKLPAVQPPAATTDDGVAADGGGTRAPPRWQCELFFAGAARAEQKAASSSWCDDGQRGGVRCYSQGVRAAAFAHHANRSSFCLASKLPSALYAASRFCLAPSGEGFGDRLATSLLAGCVPLIIQPGVRQPYDDVLPYERFSLRLGADQIPQLHTVLAGISEAQHAKLRQGVRHYRSAFDWLRPGAQAYQLARYSLCLRAERAAGCAHLRPSMLAHHHHQHSSSAGAEEAATGDFGDADNGFIDASLTRVRNGKVVPGGGRVGHVAKRSFPKILEPSRANFLAAHRPTADQPPLSLF